MWDFVMDRNGAEAGFLRELRFLLPVYIPSASPQSSSLLPEAGRAIAQAVSRRLPTALARVQTRVWSRRIL
jgi:hypothetical protein